MTSGGKDKTRAEVTCNFASCNDYDEQRRKSLEKNRSLLGESDLSIFTSGIRFGIVLMLLEMESACVCEIQYALQEPRQPLVSHHLRAMKKSGWLQSDKWKRWTFYSLKPEKKQVMMSLIQGYSG